MPVLKGRRRQGGERGQGRAAGMRCKAPKGRKEHLFIGQRPTIKKAPVLRTSERIGTGGSRLPLMKRKSPPTKGKGGLVKWGTQIPGGKHRARHARESITALEKPLSVEGMRQIVAPSSKGCMGKQKRTEKATWRLLRKKGVSLAQGLHFSKKTRH